MGGVGHAGVPIGEPVIEIQGASWQTTEPAGCQGGGGGGLLHQFGSHHGTPRLNELL